MARSAVVGESVGIFSKTGLHAIQTLLKIPAVSPVRQSIESKPSERSSAERRGLDRLIQQTVGMFYNLKFTLESKIIF